MAAVPTVASVAPFVAAFSFPLSGRRLRDHAADAAGGAGDGVAVRRLDQPGDLTSGPRHWFLRDPFNSVTVRRRRLLPEDPCSRSRPGVTVHQDPAAADPVVPRASLLVTAFILCAELAVRQKANNAAPASIWPPAAGARAFGLIDKLVDDQCPSAADGPSSIGRRPISLVCPSGPGGDSLVNTTFLSSTSPARLAGPAEFPSRRVDRGC